MQPDDYSGGTEVGSDIDLYDSEIVQIRQVIADLSQNIGKPRNLEAFRQEAINRFGEIGFHVEVRLYEAHDPMRLSKRTFIHPAITIQDRIVHEDEFDHARQSREVQTNTLKVKGAETVEQTPRVSLAGLDGDKFSKAKSGLFLPKS